MSEYLSTHPDGVEFKEEVLTSHSTSKISYHVIIKMIDKDGNAVLVGDFVTCGCIARRAVASLRDKIEKKSKPRIDPDTPGFIDLTIYNKERAFRLALSSKINSNGRPFVLKPGDVRSDKDKVLDTLVVPPQATFSLLTMEVPKSPVVPQTGRARAPRAQTGRACTEESYIKSIAPCIQKLASDRNFARWIQNLASDPPKEKLGRVSVIKDVRHDEFDHVVHCTINREFASFCYCIGREHKEHSIRISIDYEKNKVHQTCWDPKCKVSKLLLSSFPDDIMCSLKFLKEHAKST